MVHQFCQCGRVVRHQSEKPDNHVQLVALAPIVTVAEWLRRQTVDLSTRVQFPPVTPPIGNIRQRSLESMTFGIPARARRALVCEARDCRSSRHRRPSSGPQPGGQMFCAGDRAARYSAVYGDQAGSTPVLRAISSRRCRHPCQDSKPARRHAGELRWSRGWSNTPP